MIQPSSKPICVTYTNGNQQEWKSQKDAAEALQVSIWSIKKSVKGTVIRKLEIHRNIVKMEYKRNMK